VLSDQRQATFLQEDQRRLGHCHCRMQTERAAIAIAVGIRGIEITSKRRRQDCRRAITARLKWGFNLSNQALQHFAGSIV
jgi:hypothetical protein